jgi:hypothetical protein
MKPQRVILPGEVMSWEKFCATSPPNSIALDGIVPSGPVFDPKGPRVNFNHHEMVDRMATRATCAQVLIAIRQGLFETINSPTYIYVNDPDQDVCLSIFLLEHSYVAVSDNINSLVDRLVEMEDFLDTTGGSYPFRGDVLSFAKVMWVFDPYTTFRANGGIERKIAEEYDSVITEVGARIMKFVAGLADVAVLDVDYTLIGGGKDYEMVEEIGPHARIGMFAKGIEAFVCVKKCKEKDVYYYSIGRASPYIPFDVPAILEALNKAENIQPEDTDRWGGGNTIGGSPRKKGSRLPPGEVKRIIDEVIAQ